MKNSQNPTGLCGIEFVEYAGPNPDHMHRMFTGFGFSRTLFHPTKNVDYYVQNDIHFLLNKGTGTYAEGFGKSHGPSISSMGWRVDSAAEAFEAAVSRGAKACTQADYQFAGGKSVPAIYGIGESLIYFIDEANRKTFYERVGFVAAPNPTQVPQKGFMVIDHLTNNVANGQMQFWADFYKSIFGFTEVRYFDIRGVQTGLQSYALKSPDGSFCIPINEAKEEKSQINEYLREYKGPGIQHLAFLTNDILASLDQLQGAGIETLDMDNEYYEEAFKRVPQVTEDREKIKKLNVLVDGDEEGYLLQIFTKNLFGPIFIEIIQRKNHYSFGEGNFGALFRSIERDQVKRGVL